MTYARAMENRDLGRIDKLNKLINKETFYDDVRKLVKNVKSDYAIHRWQCLADMRYAELITGVEDVRTRIEYGEKERYFAPDGTEVFAV